MLGGFAAWLRERDPAGAPEVVGHERPSVGFSSETILVDVRRSGGGGPHDERLVLKLPPAGAGIFPTYDFALQARVQEAVVAAGIPAPAPVQVEDDTRWMGAPFLVMPAIDGHIVEEMPIRDRWLTKADPALSATVHSHYIDTIAAVHRLDWRAAKLDDVVPVRDNAAELAHWRAYLDWYAGGTVLVPRCVDALDWCVANRPATEPAPSLLWGDVRLGNVIFDEERVPVAVLDWEMATIGAPEHDLAWMLTLEATQAELFQRTVAGLLRPRRGRRPLRGRCRPPGARPGVVRDPRDGPQHGDHDPGGAPARPGG